MAHRYHPVTGVVVEDSSPLQVRSSVFPHHGGVVVSVVLSGDAVIGNLGKRTVINDVRYKVTT